MSDEVATSVGDAFPPSDSGQVGTSESAPSTSNEDVAVEQTSAPGKSSSKVNLNDLPEFRELKSRWDKRDAEMSRQLAQLAEEREVAKLAAMSEPQRDKYLVEKYRGMAEQAQQEAQAILMEQQRASDIKDLSTQYGVPTDVLETAMNYNAAVKLAQEWQKQVKSAARDFDDKAQRNAPDLGGGGKARVADQGDMRLMQAIQDKDGLALLRAVRGS